MEIEMKTVTPFILLQLINGKHFTNTFNPSGMKKRP